MANAENQSAVQLFPRLSERINLFLPLPFILASIYDLLHGQVLSKFISNHWDITKLIAYSLFLNAIHVGFPVAVLFGLPEGRRWLGAMAKNNRNFGLAMASLFLATVVFFGVYYYVNEQPRADRASYLILWIAAAAFLDLMLSSHHHLKQFLGISLQYNVLAKAHIGRSPNGREQFYIRWLIVVRCLHLLLRTGKLAFDGRYGKIFHPEFYNSIMEWSQPLLVVAYSVLIVGLLFSLRDLMIAPIRNKFIFLGRLLLLPFSVYSFFAFYATFFLHGVEYLMVTELMVANSEASAARVSARAAKLGFYKWGLVFFLLAATPYFSHAFGWRPWWLFAFQTLYMGLSVVHYALDRSMFQMKNSISREHIGPLLTAPAAVIQQNEEFIESKPRAAG